MSMRLTAAKSSRVTKSSAAKRPRPPPAPVMPSELEYLKTLSDNKRIRESNKGKQEKLLVVPGPVQLSWSSKSPSLDILRAMQTVLKIMYHEIPEKSMGRQGRGDLYNYRAALPPMVMSTHLHAIFLNDSTRLEREIRRATQQKLVRKLLVNLVIGGELLIQTSDYYRILDECIESRRGIDRTVYETLNSFKQLLDENPEAVSVTLSELQSKGIAEYRSYILSAGFLTLSPGQADSFNISLPNVGVYLKLVSNSRKWVIKNLDKLAWKEMLESALVERWISQKFYWKEFKGVTMEWVLSDCYGGGWCEPFNTPVGRGWKYNDKK